MSATAILNRFLDPIAQLLPTETAQQLVDLRLDSELRARIDEIADKANLYKGTNLASIDPETGLVVTLFHLRQGNWAQHFQLSGAELVGLTPQGRATVHLPKMNTPRRLELRAVLLAAGEFGS